ADRGADNALDFTFVEDAAQGLVAAALHDNASQKAYNITRGQGRTIREAAEIVARLVPGTEIGLTQRHKRMPVRGTLDVNLARREIGFAPRVDLEEGLAKYHAYLLDQSQPRLWSNAFEFRSFAW